MKAVIKNLNPKKALGYDFINNQILQKLPEIGIKFITQLCNPQMGLFFIPMDSANYYLEACKSEELAKSYYLSYRNYLRN